MHKHFVPILLTSFVICSASSCLALDSVNSESSANNKQQLEQQNKKADEQSWFAFSLSLYQTCRKLLQC